MKNSIWLLAILSLNVGAFASEVRMETHSTSSSFHLLTLKCRGQDPAGPASTPQSPPLNVDDPSTPGCNRWEINVVADGDYSKSRNELEIPLLDINYGIGDNLQLKYEVPYSRTQVGTSKVGVKYMFYNNEASELEMALYPQASIETLKDSELSSGKTAITTTVPFLLTKTLGKNSEGDVDLTVNLSYTHSGNPDLRDSGGASAGIGVPLTQRLSIMGEITTDQAVGFDSEGVRKSLLKLDVGVVTTVSKQFLLFGAVGHSLASSDHLDHEYALVGFRVLAGTGVPNDPVVASTHPKSETR